MVHNIILPILDYIMILHVHVGVEVLVGLQRETRVCKAMVLCTVCDLPAKSKLLGFSQFNGEHGCTICIHKGEVVPVGRGHTRVYGYQLPKPEQRVHTQCYEFGKRALLTKKVKSCM